MRPRSDLHNWPTARPRKPGLSPFVIGVQAHYRAEDRDLARPAKQYGRSTSIIEPWMCSRCRSWTPEGSYALGYCLTCRTPRP